MGPGSALRFAALGRDDVSGFNCQTAIRHDLSPPVRVRPGACRSSSAFLAREGCAERKGVSPRPRRRGPLGPHGSRVPLEHTAGRMPFWGNGQATEAGQRLRSARDGSFTACCMPPGLTAFAGFPQFVRTPRPGLHLGRPSVSPASCCPRHHTDFSGAFQSPMS